MKKVPTLSNFLEIIGDFLHKVRSDYEKLSDFDFWMKYDGKLRNIVSIIKGD